MTLKILPSAALCAAFAAGGLALPAAPASAQTVEELTVMGRLGDLSNARSLSQAVSYADLNLSLPAHQAEFKHRVKLTARYLCEKLGETSTTDTVAPSCRTAAERDALKQADEVIAAFPARPAAWVAGPVWVSPYPGTWVQTYPY